MKKSLFATMIMLAVANLADAQKLQAIQEYRFLLYAAAVILVLLYRPAGLFPRRLRRHFPSRASS